MCLLVNFLCRKEEFINWLLMLNGVLMGKYNNSTGAKEKYRDIISILILGPQKSLGKGVLLGRLWREHSCHLQSEKEVGFPSWKYLNVHIARCFNGRLWVLCHWKLLFVDRGCPELGFLLGEIPWSFCSLARAGKAALLKSKSISSIEHSAGNLNTPLLVWIEVKKIVEPVKNLHSRYFTDWSSASKQMLTLMYFWFWPLGWKFSV